MKPLFIRNLLWSWLFFGGISAASATSLCAIKDGETYTTLPSSSKALSSPRSISLTTGKEYKVLSESGDWVRIFVRYVPLWAERKYFSTSCSTVQQPQPDKKHISKSSTTIKSQHTETSKRVRPTRITSSDCSCGSGHLCTGPRGGRFCITSGGGKRYGG